MSVKVRYKMVALCLYMFSTLLSSIPQLFEKKFPVKVDPHTL
jgi:hypothetical protein